jgi:multidrug efflux pump
MFLSKVSIQRPILATMMNLALVLGGVIALTRLPVRELPDIDPPVISVSTVYPGANAQVVETEVTERLEEAINNIEGIKTLRSESRESVGNITIASPVFAVPCPTTFRSRSSRSRIPTLSPCSGPL